MGFEFDDCRQRFRAVNHKAMLKTKLYYWDRKFAMAITVVARNRNSIYHFVIASHEGVCQETTNQQFDHLTDFQVIIIVMATAIISQSN